MDTDAATLLSRLPVSEVREAERRLRQDVEQKREELRLTVGERYRDLLAAADSMGAMRDAAGRLLAAVTDMRASISAPDSSTHGGKGASADSTQMLQFYSIAAQVFLIQAVPEVLWHELEAGRPLQAARLCLLSRHILSQLQPRSVPSPTVSVATPLLRRFPILARQAAAAGHFRSAVLAESRAMLRTRAASDVAVAEALCASLLLQEISTRQALADFLLARKAAAQQLLSLTQHGTSIKAQVCALVESIASTLYQVHAVFWSLPAGSSSNSDLPCGLLFEQLSLLASQPVLDGDLLGEAGWSKTWVMHLPDHVREFRPAPSIPCANISPAHLTSTLQHWVDTCKQDVQEGVGRMLCFVRTVKGLAAIRDAAWELLGSQGIGRYWDLMCQRLLGKPLFIWDEFLHPVMSQRVEILLKASLDTVVTTAQHSLRETTWNVKSAALDQEPGNMAEQRGAALEQNAGPYLWTEARDDLPQDAAWVGTAKAGEVTKTHDRPLICGLSLKALGVTPVVQAFCTELNSGLGDCLADLATYLPPAPGRDPGQKITVEQVPAAGACIHGDTPHILNELHSETLRCLRLLTDCAKDLPSTAETENGDEARQGLAVTLFLARTFGAIPLLCPALRSCLSGLGESAQSRRGGQEGSSDGSWKEAQALLAEQSLWAYEAWAGGVAESAIAEFSEKMCNATPGAFMANTPKWEDMEIQEESETGETVCSKISLPSQASWAVAQLLFRLCQEINAAGGHALPKPPRLALLRSVLDGVLATYRRLLDAVKSDLPMTQKWALQLTFDLRFLHSTFSQKTGATNRIRSSPDPRLEPLLDELEGFVDPFDLDVFTPHIAANLGRLAQRTATVYGLLGTSECLTLPKSSSSTPESHQVLDLCNCSGRFALLPVSSSHGSRHAATPKAEIPQDTVSTQLQAVAQPGTLFQQLADKDSSVGVPSLFTLGWLTGIAK